MRRPRRSASLRKRSDARCARRRPDARRSCGPSNDDVENARSLNTLVRHGLRLSERVEAFARGGYFRDLFSGVEHRVNADAGFSYVAPQPPQRALKIDFGVGATREVRLFDADQAVLNATIGASFRARLTPSAEVTAESQGVADFAHASNWRVDQRPFIEYRLRLDSVGQVVLFAPLRESSGARLPSNRSHGFRCAGVPVRQISAPDVALIVRRCARDRLTVERRSGSLSRRLGSTVSVAATSSIDCGRSVCHEPDRRGTRMCL